MTLAKDRTSSTVVAWSKTARGPYMPTPLAYRGILYSLNNDGIFDAYEVETGKEVYRQRLDPVGSGFSASPVAAEGRIYFLADDGLTTIIEAGDEFKILAKNPIGERVQASMAVSGGQLFIRGERHLYAIGKR